MCVNTQFSRPKAPNWLLSARNFKLSSDTSIARGALHITPSQLGVLRRALNAKVVYCGSLTQWSLDDTKGLDILFAGVWEYNRESKNMVAPQHESRFQPTSSGVHGSASRQRYTDRPQTGLTRTNPTARGSLHSLSRRLRHATCSAPPPFQRYSWILDLQP